MCLKSLLRTTGLAAILFNFNTVNAQIDTTTISAKLLQAKEKLGKDFAFMLYKDGKVMYKKEVGNFTIKTPEPIGASSQWLTAALVMTFVQEGRISLDDKVATYLPVFTKHFKSYITIRQCLTHFTGIQDELGVAKLLQKNKFHTLEEAVNNYAEKREIETNAGEQFKYSNLGFNIAGRVLEIVSKKPFDRLMRDRIIRPLGMKGSTFTNEDYNLAVNPSTGGVSTAADYTNFLAMLLNKGTFNNVQILTPASVDMLHSLQVEASKMKYAPETEKGLNYGFGEWILETNAQGKASSVTVPSLQGTWPMIDLCRGYACVIFTKELSGEQNRNLYLNIKAAIDEEIKGSCE